MYMYIANDNSKKDDYNPKRMKQLLCRKGGRYRLRSGYYSFKDFLLRIDSASLCFQIKNRIIQIE